MASQKTPCTFRSAEESSCKTGCGKMQNRMPTGGLGSGGPVGGQFGFRGPTGFRRYGARKKESISADEQNAPEKRRNQATKKDEGAAVGEAPKVREQLLTTDCDGRPPVPLDLGLCF
ncbi:MAG: hypothetical protein GY820_03345 [Gammaproteobacteria bacterium]|nr:hypothetical protein [Gammaproteobacteria bacterium]